MNPPSTCEGTCHGDPPNRSQGLAPARGQTAPALAGSPGHGPGGGSGRAEPATLQAPAERCGWEEASQKTES